MGRLLSLMYTTPARPCAPAPSARPTPLGGGVRGTDSLHYAGTSPQEGGKVFVAACGHSTEHVAHGAVITASLGRPYSCANVGLSALRSAKASTLAHSSPFSPHEAVMTALRACGRAPMPRHTLPPSAPMADSVSLTRLSHPRRAILPRAEAHYRTAYTEIEGRGEAS